MTFANAVTNLQMGMPAQTNSPIQFSFLPPFGNIPGQGINYLGQNFGQIGGGSALMPFGTQLYNPNNLYNLSANQAPMSIFPNVNLGMQMFNMPQFNFQNPFAQYFQFNNTNAQQSTIKSDDSNKQTENKEKQSGDSGKTKTDAETLAALKKLGYNEEKGRKLAKVAKEHCAGRSYGKCATWVKQDIEKAGYGKYKSGHGKDIDNAYAANSNFKLVDATKFDCKKLPPGCVQVFEAGEAGYHKVYGHTQIIGKDGKGYSDCAIRNIKQSKQILIPV